MYRQTEKQIHKNINYCRNDFAEFKNKMNNIIKLRNKYIIYSNYKKFWQ